MPGRSSATHERHEAAVLRAAEVGVDQAAIEYSITVPRLKAWMAKSQTAATEVVSIEPLELEPEPESDDPIERLQVLAREQRQIAALANKQTDALLRMMKGTEARNTASAGKYATSAAVELERAVREEREHWVRMDELQAAVLAEHVRRLLDPLGARSGSLASLVRWWLGTLGDVYVDESGVVNSPQCPPEVAGSARAALWASFEGEIRREVEEGLRRRAQERSEGDAVVDELADAAYSTKPVEAEAVEPKKKSLEQEAKEMAARICARMQAQAVDQESFGVGWRESSASSFDQRAPGL